MVLVPDIGFATFQIEGSSCYIVDIYVEKSFRKGRYATMMADQIAEIAKRKGCTALLGTVQTNTNKAETSELVLKAYGMRFEYEIQSKNLKFFKKDI